MKLTVMVAILVTLLAILPANAEWTVTNLHPYPTGYAESKSWGVSPTQQVGEINNGHA